MSKKTNKSISSETNNTSVMTVSNYNKKMGVYKYLSLYPQDIYISNLLKKLYPRTIQTKLEWDKTITDLLNTNVK